LADFPSPTRQKTLKKRHHCFGVFFGVGKLEINNISHKNGENNYPKKQGGIGAKGLNPEPGYWSSKEAQRYSGEMPNMENFFMAQHQAVGVSPFVKEVKTARGSPVLPNGTIL